METLPPRIMSLRKKRAGEEKGVGSRFAWHALLPVILISGCVTTDSFQSMVGDNLAPVPCQLVAAWSPEVRFTPDPARRGEPTPGIAGRVYLFGQEINRPLQGAGCLVVDLYDATPGKEKPGAPLEEWRFDRDTLKRLERRDAIGWGYTIFLPWGTYSPDITSVQLRLCYTPLKGTPLYAHSASVTLNRNDVLLGKIENTNHVIAPRVDSAALTPKN